MKQLWMLIILLSISIHTYGQKKNTLSKELWLKVESCYSMLKDEDGKVQSDEIIDDSKNGYLKVSGSFPTCGCNCNNTVGAYKTNSDRYIFLKKSVWSCSWKNEVTSGNNLSEIFPINFEENGFFSSSLKKPEQNATFYIDFEIPRKGTDTKATIKLIPFGLNIKSKKNIEFTYSERVDNYKNLNYISKIADEIKNTETLKYLLNNEFDIISNYDLKLINNLIDNCNYSKSDLIRHLKELKRKYDLYIQIKYQILVLSWNQEKGTFYIKEKGKSIKEISFLEFLKKGEYWSPMC